MSGEFELAYRRVDENPVLEQLARQVCDQLEAWKAEGKLTVRLSTAIALARAAGVPLAYVFAERERRNREGKGAADGNERGREP